MQAFFSPLSHRKLSSLFPSILNSLLNSAFHQNMRLKLYHVVCPTHGHCVLVDCIPFLIFVSREYPLCPKALYVYFAHCAVMAPCLWALTPFLWAFSSSCVTSQSLFEQCFSTQHLQQLLFSCSLWWNH